MKLPLTDILVADRFRQQIDKKELNLLRVSIQLKGLINPVTVTNNDDPDGPPYRLMAGGRRFMCAQELGWTEIPVNLFDGLNEIDRLEIEYEENFYRQDLTWPEQLSLTKKIHDLKMEKAGARKDPKAWSQKQTAEEIKMNPGQLSDDLQLADLVEKIPAIAKFAKTKAEAHRFVKKMALKKGREDKAKAVLEDRKREGLPDSEAKLLNSFVVKDFFSGVSILKPDSVDFINLDPPWGVNLNVQKKGKQSTKAATDYEEVSDDQYHSFISKTLKECYRVLKPGCWIIHWYDIKKHEQIVALMEEAGFEVGLSIPAIWVKHTGQTQAPSRYLGRSWEPFIYARKGPAQIYKQGRLDVFDYPGINAANKVHPAEKPIDMLLDILATFANPGDFILDCFAGSGNMLLAGCNFKCHGIGFDTSQDHKNAYVLKVAQQKYGEFTSRPI